MPASCCSSTSTRSSRSPASTSGARRTASTRDLRTGIVWVTLTASNQVVGVDFSGGTPRKVAAYPTVRQPDTVAVAPGSHTLWVTGTRGDEIERITR